VGDPTKSNTGFAAAITSPGTGAPPPCANSASTISGCRPARVEQCFDVAAGMTVTAVQLQTVIELGAGTVLEREHQPPIRAQCRRGGRDHVP